jgi:hypothetical protein
MRTSCCVTKRAGSGSGASAAGGWNHPVARDTVVPRNHARSHARDCRAQRKRRSASHQAASLSKVTRCTSRTPPRAAANFVAACCDVNSHKRHSALQPRASGAHAQGAWPRTRNGNSGSGPVMPVQPAGMVPRFAKLLRKRRGTRGAASDARCVRFRRVSRWLCVARCVDCDCVCP